VVTAAREGRTGHVPGHMPALLLQLAAPGRKQESERNFDGRKKVCYTGKSMKL